MSEFSKLSNSSSQYKDGDGVTILKVSKKDIPEIFALQEKFIKKGALSWDSSEDELNRIIDFRESIVAKYKNKVIAYLLTVDAKRNSTHPFHKVCPNLHFNSTIVNFKSCLSQICINEEWQNRGLFSKLYKNYREIDHKFDIRFFVASKTNEKSIHVHCNKLDAIVLGEVGRFKEYLLMALCLDTKKSIKPVVENLLKNQTDSIT